MRKFIMALAAVALFGAFVAPTSADAGWRGHHYGWRGHHHGFRHHYWRPRHHFGYRPYWRPIRYAYAAPVAYGWGSHCVIKRKIRWNRWGHPVRVVKRICY